MQADIPSYLGDFEIRERLGAGGMGVVYRASDLKLGREVAIKVLPEVLANDPDRLARFQREARLLASLNHANIAAIHEIGHDGKTHFLVMELVAGKTLADLLDVRCKLALDQVLPLFAQIADALEYAHERNIIHRDLKPANVMVTERGMVKLLDFGLAKALEERTVSTGESMTRDADSGLVTGQGHVLGTPAYMAPEQASGKQLDKRADIWAFGCCLYEALSGKRPFVGNNATELMARILEREPDWETLDSSVPNRVRILIWRCLQKDPRRRLRDIGEARFELGDSATEISGVMASLGSTATPAPRVTGRGLMWGLIGAAIAMIATLGVATLVGSRSVRPADPRMLVERSIHNVINDRGVQGIYILHQLGYRESAIAISPDGQRIAYVANLGEEHQLYLRERHEFRGTPMPGTRGAYMPFFAPDGKSLGFFTRDALHVVSIQGGKPTVVCGDVRNANGGCWAPNNTIYFVEEEGQKLSSVDLKTAGNTKRVLCERALPLYAPRLLPDGKGLLATSFFESKEIRGHDYATTLYIPLDGSGGVPVDDSGEIMGSRPILDKGYSAAFVSSGHLVFIRGDSLWAADFDLESLTVNRQSERMVVDGVLAPGFALSDSGDLVYLAGHDNWKCSPYWFDRLTGEETPVPIKEALEFGTFDLSSDDRRLAIQVNGVGSEIKIYDLVTKQATKLLNGEASGAPVWKPGYSTLAFQSFLDGASVIALKDVDTTKKARKLTSVPEGYVAPFSFTPAGDKLLYIAPSPRPRDATMDIRVLSTDSSLDTDNQSWDYLATPFNDWSPAFSPDGKWVAYTSDRDGQYKVYIQRYPSTEEKWPPISDGLGEEPIWSPVGDELFYRSGSRIMSVKFNSVEELKHAQPQVAMETRFVNVTGLSYDVSSDGKRFLILKPEFDDTAISDILIVRNWTTELTRLMSSEN
jgi:serine/threonine-protein kinase